MARRVVGQRRMTTGSNFRPITDLARRSALESVHELLGGLNLKSKAPEPGRERAESDSGPVQTRAQAPPPNPVVFPTPVSFPRPKPQAHTARKLSWTHAIRQLSWTHILWSCVLSFVGALFLLIIFRPDFIFKHEDVVRLAPQISANTFIVVAAATTTAALSAAILLVTVYIRNPLVEVPKGRAEDKRSRG
jgi:hypothetical protein